jgi:hypothetical protein
MEAANALSTFEPIMIKPRLLTAALLTTCAVTTVAHAADPPVDFNRQIRPILSDKCFACHGPDAKKREGDLRLDTEEGAKAKLEDHFAIVPGKPKQSSLVERINSTDEDERMPSVDSGKSLTPEEIKLLTRWIAEGATWSAHWAYVAPKRHPAPKVRRGDWAVGWIDQFLLARLEREGLSPSPDADRVTLIRRLTFDLIGLPPTSAEVDAFVADKRPDAYKQLVDRLLASPHYGERMAMYWLDLVRYADTVGYHGDQDQNISPYRDWVIQAFNDNMPYDQFAREQLAGDLLPNATIDQKVATGYNRLLQTSHEGGVQAKEYLAIYAADRVRNVSGVWMGATMGCCQCHDHKFDPYTSRDFYSLVAFFADVDEAQHFRRGSNSLPTNRPPEIAVHSKRQRKQIAVLKKQLAQPGVAKDKAAAATLKKQLASLEKAKRKTMVSVSIKPREIRVLPRGNWLDDSGPVVRPAIPAFLGKLDTGDRRATRLDLANWLTDTKQGTGGLTARVMANRLWYLYFGVGISKVLDDFGGQGQPPVHPELLDNLAAELIKSEWDLKHLARLIVTSRAYRQASLTSKALQQRDPYNRLVARQSRFRLPAESVRDTALSISGLLTDEIGGASIKPYQPAGYYRHLNFPARRYAHHKDARQWRRGVYVHWQRQFVHPMLKAFDAPSREECTAERPRSNTPIASLVLLNDPTFVEAARVFAARILTEGGKTSGERFEFAMRQATSRKPDAEEIRLLEQLLVTSRKRYQADIDAARKLIAAGQAPAAKNIDAAQLAAWTTVARAILNLNETYTRN